MDDHLVAEARSAGLLNPQVSTDFGGMGLSHLGKAVVLEASSYSMLGPIAMIRGSSIFRASAMPGSTCI
ncbi:hypothetical protein DPM13_09200 [Paracoccus mutanolyticus]|uniref:Acyl-CoA dehydrogenase/oxidase N-terminal domain-containing protein n=1 Tax=Paracoccus mutanolyticus TaxID=1499308 RepID=A0ABM6WRH3_9RHOB|nr:hypothetical protein DPM13_09200 [Paracoccus mutanolyticus]